MSVSIKGSKPNEKHLEFSFEQKGVDIHIYCNGTLIGWIKESGELEVSFPSEGLPVDPKDGLWKVIR